MNSNILERFIRISTSYMRKHLNDDLYYSYTRLIKRVRSIFFRKKIINKFLFTHNELDIGNNSNDLTVALTFDIDSLKCFKQLYSFADLNRSLEIVATYHFLTSSNYPIEKIMLQNLNNLGNEVGLHGDYHDLYLGFRSEKTIRKRIESMLTEFPIENRPISFRHPGFGMTNKLALILEDYGFKFDTSIKSGPYLTEENILSGPNRLYDTNIIEYYTLISDDSILREDKLSREIALRILENLAFECSQQKIPLVANFHPGIVSESKNFYISCLRTLSNNFKVTFKKVRDLRV